MVSRDDISVIVVNEQFRRFSESRVRVTILGDVSVMSEEERERVKFVTCLQAFSLSISDTARWN